MFKKFCLFLLIISLGSHTKIKPIGTKTLVRILAENQLSPTDRNCPSFYLLRSLFTGNILQEISESEKELRKIITFVLPINSFLENLDTEQRVIIQKRYLNPMLNREFLFPFLSKISIEAAKELGETISNLALLVQTIINENQYFFCSLDAKGNEMENLGNCTTFFQKNADLFEKIFSGVKNISDGEEILKIIDRQRAELRKATRHHMNNSWRGQLICEIWFFSRLQEILRIRLAQLEIEAISLTKRFSLFALIGQDPEIMQELESFGQKERNPNAEPPYFSELPALDFSSRTGPTKRQLERLKPLEPFSQEWEDSQRNSEAK